MGVFLDSVTFNLTLQERQMFQNKTQQKITISQLATSMV